MRHHRLATLLIWIAALTTSLAIPAAGFEVEDRISYPAAQETAMLRIISTADRAVFEPILLAFQVANPGISIDYTITGTSDLMQAIHVEGAVFDLAISSAMDLQTKLANDGYAGTYRSAQTDALPDWARWRNQLFAFTQEPAVLVVSERDFPDAKTQLTRDSLITLLRDNPDRFRGRIGTYDVRSSGFGYLMATQDSRNSEAFWRLMEVMGRLDAQLYCCSGDMIRDVASGKLALAYNVLGSYAAAQLPNTQGFRIIELSDFVNVMLRTALIPANAENRDAAEAMVDFLVTLNTRPELVAASGLPAVNSSALIENDAMRPVRFGPGLLVFLDRLKRDTFLRSWVSSLEQD